MSMFISEVDLNNAPDFLNQVNSTSETTDSASSGQDSQVVQIPRFLQDSMLLELNQDTAVKQTIERRKNWFCELDYSDGITDTVQCMSYLPRSQLENPDGTYRWARGDEVKQYAYYVDTLSADIDK